MSLLCVHSVATSPQGFRQRAKQRAAQQRVSNFLPGYNAKFFIFVAVILLSLALASVFSTQRYAA